MFFISPLKPFLLRYLSCCPEICGHVEFENELQNLWPYKLRNK